MMTKPDRSSDAPPQTNGKLPVQRWQIATPRAETVAQTAQITGLFPLLAQVVVNQGIVTPEALQGFLEPETQVLPDPLEEFADLATSVALLEAAIATQQKIAICGDYDADGMTSTALLLQALRALGAQVDYAIPSRMQEGYGINCRIVEDFATESVSLILTVDNGIAAPEPIARARELGLTVIVTDHHDLPPDLPPANAILNPKLLRPDSPYRGLAGVGVAYILAVSLAQQRGEGRHLITPLLELFTLGTIADLAPLTGVNRRWLKRGLQLLPRSQQPGVRALMQVSGCDGQQAAPLKPEAIGFRLGPRINAVGRIGDPQTVIDLLTTTDSRMALQRATECEQANLTRKRLCVQIEQAAVDYIENKQTLPLEDRIDPQKQRVIVIVQPSWHHGVIGIVASRLVERYGVPVFIGTYEEADPTQIRGSARGIPEFDVFAALQYCADLLGRFGGHFAAGGFSLPTANLSMLRSRLSQFAHEHLHPHHLKPLVVIDGQANFSQITWDLYAQIDRLHPCGIGNREPIFWTPQVRVLDQRLVGTDKAHLKLTLAQQAVDHQPPVTKQAMAWRWGEYHPLPEWIDVAYRLRENNWRGQQTLELELMGARPAQAVPPSRREAPSPETPQSPPTDPVPMTASPISPPVGLLPQQEPELSLPEPPPTNRQDRQWHSCPDLQTCLAQLQGHVLLYGDQRPYVSKQAFSGSLEYDRPTQICDTLILWTLPPSPTHLNWLLALGRPQVVYVRNTQPKIPEMLVLRSHLKFELVKSVAKNTINLLHLGQQWWVSPSVLVAALRELGYTCPSYPKTELLEQELKQLKQWYEQTASELALQF